MSGKDASELVHYSSTPEAAFITLDSPSTRNALSQALVDQLIARIDEAAQSSCNVVVLTHTDPVFCAGMDLKDTRSVDLGGLTQVMLALRNVPQPTMAVLTVKLRCRAATEQSIYGTIDDYFCHDVNIYLLNIVAWVTNYEPV